MSRAAKRINKEEQVFVSELAQALRIPVTSDVWSYVEVGERWDERHDTSSNVVTIKLPRRDITFSLPAIFEMVAKFPNIEEVQLNQNNLGAGFPATLPSTLERLYVDNNPQLNGELPAAMKFRNLKVLWLSNCGMKGSIPFGIGDLWSLKQLYLAENNFDGRLPDTFATLPLLEVLDVRQNKLKGSVPRSFSRLENIAQIDLSYNQFSGAIPLDRFANMATLNWLNLTNNSFLETASAHRELQAQLPNAIVKVHAPKQTYRPSPKPSFPRPRFRPLPDEVKPEVRNEAKSEAKGDSAAVVTKAESGSAGRIEGAAAEDGDTDAGGDEEEGAEFGGAAQAGPEGEGAEGEGEEYEEGDEEGSEYEDEEEEA
jgi:hypothetical protein